MPQGPVLIDTRFPFIRVPVGGGDHKVHNFILTNDAFPLSN